MFRTSTYGKQLRGLRRPVTQHKYCVGSRAFSSHLELDFETKVFDKQAYEVKYSSSNRRLGLRQCIALIHTACPCSLLEPPNT